MSAAALTSEPFKCPPPRLNHGGGGGVEVERTGTELGTGQDPGIPWNGYNT